MDIGQVNVDNQNSINKVTWLSRIDIPTVLNLSVVFHTASHIFNSGGRRPTINIQTIPERLKTCLHMARLVDFWNRCSGNVWLQGIFQTYNVMEQSYVFISSITMGNKIHSTVLPTFCIRAAGDARQEDTSRFTSECKSICQTSNG